MNPKYSFSNTEKTENAWPYTTPQHDPLSTKQHNTTLPIHGSLRRRILTKQVTLQIPTSGNFHIGLWGISGRDSHLLGVSTCHLPSNPSYQAAFLQDGGFWEESLWVLLCVPAPTQWIPFQVSAGCWKMPTRVHSRGYWWLYARRFQEGWCHFCA